MNLRQFILDALSLVAIVVFFGGIVVILYHLKG